MQFYFLTLSEAKQMINKRSYKLVVIFTIILTLFINMAVASLAASLEDIQSQITHQQANKNELKNELAGLRAEIEAQKKEDAKITAEMAAILAQKQEQATIVEQMLDDLDYIYEQIEGYYNSIQQAEEEYNKALEKFYTRARIMYRYTQYDSLRLFVEAEDIFDYANRDKLFSRMMENDREALRGLLVMKQDLESKKQIQEQLKVDAEALLLEKQAIIEAIEKNEKIVAEKLEASRGSLAILEAQESKIEAESYKIESEIKNMPNYFADYNTTVNFISQEELNENHKGLPHGGFVIRSGKTGWNGEHQHIIEYSLKLDSNPEFTSSVLVACARAAYRMAAAGDSGCKTVLDIPPAYLSAKSGEELRKSFL